MLRHVTATRYVTPFREGGSLPGLMEADDLGTYVVKFHGAGQGAKVLVAEVITTELARALGLPVPELVTVELDPALAGGEPDPEIQELLRASNGINLGVDFLPGALDFSPKSFTVDGGFAGRVLWLDALVNNVDRSRSNPNVLYWHKKTHLIDHGSSLIFHHDWRSAPAAVDRAYAADEHVLIGFGPDVDAADEALAGKVTIDLLQRVVEQVPDQWLSEEPGFDDVDSVRAAYVDHLSARLRRREAWLPGLREASRRAAEGPKTAARGNNRPSWLTDPGAR